MSAIIDQPAHEGLESAGLGVLERFPHEDGLLEVRLESDIAHECPFKEETDYGQVLVIYAPREWVLELESFNEYLKGLSDMRITHEELTQVIAADMQRALDCKVAVKTTFITSGIKVVSTCELVLS
jgi:NADPH-dependent 7-cyano-7-deazaguanine reductase QueF